MKKALLLASLALAAGTAHAQTPLTKGKGLLTGTIGYRRESSGATRDLFEFAPKVGTFVADNLAVGISASISLYGGNADRFGSNSYAVGPFARYYRFVGGDKFALFGQGSLGYTRTNETGSDGYNQGFLSVTPGLAFFPIPRFGLEASLRGLSYATNFDGAYNLDLGFSLNNFQLGAAYYFGK